MTLALHKLTLAWPNLVDGSSVSGGSYTSARPLGNVQQRELAERARSVDTDPANTQLLIEFDRRRTIGFIGIAAHNLSPDATFRAYVRDAADAVVVDTGDVLAWPPVLGLEQVAWEDPNFWTRQLDSEQRAEYTPFAWHVFEPTSLAHSVLLEINDAGNPDGYVEFGRVIVADVWQPDTNMSFGSQWGHDDSTTVQETEDGSAEFFDEAPRRRTFSAELGRLDQNEAFDVIARMQRVQGTSREIVILNELADTPQRHRRSMLARLVELDPITHPYAHNWTSSIAGREIL